jgi:hypothetical protein
MRFVRLRVHPTQHARARADANRTLSELRPELHGSLPRNGRGHRRHSDQTPAEPAGQNLDSTAREETATRPASTSSGVRASTNTEPRPVRAGIPTVDRGVEVDSLRGFVARPDDYLFSLRQTPGPR